MEIRVLGPMEVVADGNPVSIGGPKQRLVLALLVVADGAPLSVDTLVDRVWGDAPPGDAPSSIHTYVSRLRSVFGDRLERTGAGYALRLEADEVDARCFERLVGDGRGLLSGDPEAAARVLREALALWRGRPYADLADELTLRPEVTRLEELRVATVEDRVEADLALGRHAELVSELEVFTAEYPFRERFRSQQMLALYRAGRQAEALRAYQSTRTVLVEELGIDPSPELQQLEERILRQDPDLEVDLAPRVEQVALLFTDLEDSTVLWELHPAAMQPALQLHDRLLDDAVVAGGGRVFKRTGDGICAAFADVVSAVKAAEEIQRSLSTADWVDTPPLKARIAVDTGEAESRGGDYFGPVMNRCARIMASGHGSQTLLTDESVKVLTDTPDGWQVKALGEFRFRGLGRPQAVYQLVVEGLPAEFPPLRIDRMPPPLPGTAFGRSVRGHELREQIGAGDFGVVYRAYQPSVGREVAVKVIRPEYVDQPAFIRRFEAEAQLVAQLEHPHIVALYDYWRDPDGAYLVFRWLRGGSLRAALDRGPFHLEAAIELLEQVGGALSYAHRQGVAHRDLKPSNILLDEEGNGYLTDFGIAARLADASEAGRPYATSPAYVPPEELRGEPLTVASDIYGLGLLTFELLTGRPPPMDGPLPAPSSLALQLPAAVDEVITRATAELPADRYPNVDEFLNALRQSLGAIPVTEETAFTHVRNPYKGLHAFGEVDAADFFGRDQTVTELLAAVGEHRLVAAVGPSGSGKSSVVRAGLIPALRAGGLPGSREWLVTTMFPGAHPFEELEAALLRVATDAPANLDELLRSDERGLVRASKQLFSDDMTVVLVIDQFEELFTLTRNDETRRRFLEALVEVASDERSRLRVVLTLRADFFDHPLQYPDFGDLLRTGLVTVTAMSDQALAEAIERPASGVGVRLEAGLVDHIVSDVHDQPGALPLLQYALTELFSARHTDLLTIEGYRATGGVKGALGRRAEDLYAGLDEAVQQAGRQLFLRLVTVSEDREDTRRRVRRSEVEGLADSRTIGEVLDVFGKRRLVSFDRDPVTRGPTVEVAHEALLTEWARLAGWIDDQQEGLLLHGRFRGAVDEWIGSARSADFLLSGGRLSQFEAWADNTDLALAADEQEYLTLSRDKQVRDRTRRRRLRRGIMSGFALATVIAVGLAIFAFGQQHEADESAAVARIEELAAESAAALGSDSQLAMLLALEAVGLAEGNHPDQLLKATTALHEAVNSNRLVKAFGPEYQAFAFDLANERIYLFGDEGNAVTELIDGRWTDATPLDWLPDAPQAYSGGLEEIKGVIDPKGETLALVRQFPRNATGGERPGMYASMSLWDLASGAQIATTEEAQELWIDAPGDEMMLGFGDDWTQPLLTTSGSHVVETALEALPGVTDVSVEGFGTEEEPWTVQFVDVSRPIEHLAIWAPQRLWLDDPAASFVVRISPDDNPGKQLSGADTEMFVDAVQSMRPGVAMSVVGSGTESDPWIVLPEPESAVAPPWLALDGDGTHDDLPLKSVLGAGQYPHLQRIVFSPDGTRLGTVSFQLGVHVLNGRTLEVEQMFEFEDPPPAFLASGVEFSPDGRHLGVASRYVERPLLWDLETGESTFISEEPWAGHFKDVAFFDDGRMIITGQFGATAVWDPVSGEYLYGAPVEWTDGFWSVDVHPVGVFALGGADGDVLVFTDDPVYRTAVPLLTLRGHTGVARVEFGPQGRYLASAHEGGGVSIWDVTGTGPGELLAFEVPDLYHTDWSPDGRTIAATGPEGGLTTVDVETGEVTEYPTFAINVPPSPEEEHEEAPDPDEGLRECYLPGAAFAPDGDRLAASLECEHGGGTAVVNLATGAAHLLSETPAIDISWSADGSRIAASFNGQAIVWDAATYGEVFAYVPSQEPEEDEEEPPQDELDPIIDNAIAMSPDGRLLAAQIELWSTTEGHVRVWDVDRGDLVGVFSGCAPARWGFGSLQFLSDGALLCAGADLQGRLSGSGIWDPLSGELLEEFDGHAGEVFAAAPSGDGSLIVTAGPDGTIVLWDGRTRDRLAIIEYPGGDVIDVKLSHDGTRMATTDWDSIVRVWALDAGELVSIAEDRLVRSFTPFECETYEIRSDRCPADS
ncbi:MAG: BTAD domain-containing putative transcriptional regulator [Acidimicrobiia bacterium]|nr:BTAD domain-containing putative transcriptional regulator [Acidimicrobiia bacterium]